MSVLKNLSFVLIFSIIFFTGCSSKKDYVNNGDIYKYYKDTSNGQIINSRSMHKYTMRPYNVFGITYTPFVANIGDNFTGIASWYGPDFHDKKTSNGEIYNMYALTAAHKTLPMNTMVRVDNQENGKSIVVRINDRGPFVRGRIIDLSNKAAHAIDMVRKGTAKVKVTVLGYNGELENGDAPFDSLPNQENIKVATVETPVTALTSPIGEKIETLEESFMPTQIKEEKIVSTKNDLKPVEIKEEKIAAVGSYSLQVGAFSKAEGAIKTRDEYQKKFSGRFVQAKRHFSNGRYLFKVMISGFNSQNQAQIFKEQNNLIGAIIITN